MGTYRSKVLVPFLAIACVVGISCERDSPPTDGSALVVARASLSDNVNQVRVTVSGSKLPSAVSQSLSLSGSQYSAWIQNLPPGNDYTFTAVAVDESANVLLQGSVSRQTIAQGRTASVTIYLSKGKTAYASSAPVIDSVSATSLTASYGDTLQFQAAAHDADPDDTAQLTFNWTATCGTFTKITNTPGTDVVGSKSLAAYMAPTEGQRCSISLLVADAAKHSTVTSLDIVLKEAVGQASIGVLANGAPVLSLLAASPGQLPTGGSTVIQAFASDPDAESLNYAWSTSCPGSFDSTSLDTATFTLAPQSQATSCTFSVFIDDGRDERGNLKNTSENHLTLAVGEPSVVVSPTFGVGYQSDDSFVDGQAVSLAIQASDPAQGTMTYTWTTSAGPTPIPVAPADLGFDRAVFNAAASWVAPAGLPSTSLVAITVTATSSVSSLSARYTYVLVPRSSVCAIMAGVCPTGQVCNPRNGACIAMPE
jgi:hypothetical protein